MYASNYLLSINVPKEYFEKLQFLSYFVTGNDESDESEESHDEDEEEDVPASYSPARNNNELEPDSLDDINDGTDLNSSDQSALWPIQ